MGLLIGCKHKQTAGGWWATGAEEGGGRRRRRRRVDTYNLENSHLIVFDRRSAAVDGGSDPDGRQERERAAPPRRQTVRLSPAAVGINQLTARSIKWHFVFSRRRWSNGVSRGEQSHTSRLLHLPRRRQLAARPLEPPSSLASPSTLSFHCHLSCDFFKDQWLRHASCSKRRNPAKSTGGNQLIAFDAFCPSLRNDTCLSAAPDCSMTTR